LFAPEAICFDLGGTLLIEERYDLAAGLGALLEEGLLPLAAGADGAEFERAIARARDAGAELRLRDWLRGSSSEAVADASLERAEETIWRAGVRFHPAPGAHDLLDELAAEQLPMAIVSNGVFGGRTLAGELERHGMRRPFPCIVSSADAGRRKPDPAPFERALRRLRVPAARSWFVGDSFAADVAGAAALGLAAVWIHPAGAAPPPGPVPHARVSSLEELLGLYLESRRARR